MNGYLLILKMIANEEPRSSETEVFPGQYERYYCPVCERIISLARRAVAEAENENTPKEQKGEK